MKTVIKLVFTIAILNLIGCGDKQENTQIEKKTEAIQSTEVKAATPPQVTHNTKTPKALFAKCIACHGSHAEKSALNKSQVIQGWSVEKISNALNGYKNGTYGGDMKGLMKSQIASYSDEEIKMVATFISNL